MNNQPVLRRYTGVRLHSGYAHVWEKVRKCLIDHIKAEIEADGPIEEWGVHGHSAGGALAQIW